MFCSITTPPRRLIRHFCSIIAPGDLCGNPSTRPCQATIVYSKSPHKSIECKAFWRPSASNRLQVKPAEQSGSGCPSRQQRIPKNKLFAGAIRALDVPEQGVYNEPCEQAKPGEGSETFARLMEPHWDKEVVLSQLCPSTSTNAEPAALASSGARR
jgi:hypothetical protein